MADKFSPKFPEIYNATSPADINSFVDKFMRKATLDEISMTEDNLVKQETLDALAGLIYKVDQIIANMWDLYSTRGIDITMMSAIASQLKNAIDYQASDVASKG